MKIVVSLILFLSFNTMAGEVTKFDPRPAMVDQDSNTYVGVLLSEEDFRKMLQDKINTSATLAECSVDKRVCNKMEETYKISIIKLEDQLKRNNSWFDKNRGTVGILTGLIVGVGMSVGIVHAVYQR